MKKIQLFIPLVFIALSLQAAEDADQVTIARRMKMTVCDLQSPLSNSSFLNGKKLADEIEAAGLANPGLLEKIIVIKRSETGKPLADFRLDDILGIIQKGQDLKLEAVLAGTVIPSSNGTYAIQIQLIDVQKKNVPSSRRVLNYANIEGVNPSPDSVLAGISKLVSQLSTGTFPRVDIITPNFDVVSINQINKDEFPLMKLSVSIVNNRGEPVSVPPDLFEIRENGNMVSADIQRSKTSDTVYTPITLLLAIDRSPSMMEELDGRNTGGPLKRAKAAALEFINKMAPQDVVKIVTFDFNVTNLGDYTKEKSSYSEKVNGITTGLGTGLYNVLKYCIEDIAKIKGEKAVVLLTDGKNDVRGAPEEVKNVTLEDGLDIAQKLAVPVYTIGFANADSTILNEVAQKTHSRFFKAASSESLRDLYNQLHKIIENQYIISYTSLADKSGKVNVSLNIKQDERQFTLSSDEQGKMGEFKKNVVIQKELEKVVLQQKEVDTLRQQIDKDRKSLEERTRSLTDKQNQLEQREGDIKTQSEKLKEKEKILADLEKSIKEKTSDLNSRSEVLRLEQQKFTNERSKTLEIRRNIMKANLEILDYLKLKSDLINEQNRRLESLTNETQK
jgi:hypothetical protein